MKNQVVICCPTFEGMSEQDKREIYNLLEFKKRIKKVLTRETQSDIINLSNERER